MPASRKYASSGGFHSPPSYLWLSSHPLAGPLEGSLHVVHSYVLKTMSSENVLKVYAHKHNDITLQSINSIYQFTPPMIEILLSHTQYF